MACSRCLADPQPTGYRDPRECAFDSEGNFTPDNWNCATLNLLSNAERFERTLYGCDESVQTIPVPYDDDLSITDGFIVLTRYKHRGKISAAVWMGDFWPIKPLTLEVAERSLRAVIP